jgi:hypothetical protein
MQGRSLGARPHATGRVLAQVHRPRQEQAGECADQGTVKGSKFCRSRVLMLMCGQRMRPS